MPRLRRLGISMLAIVVVLTIGAGVVGFLLFNRDQGDPLQKADAIVVLGGEWDGRVDYGLDLARSGYADTVVLSDGYGDHRLREVTDACDRGPTGIRVICFRPDPYTTQGEAKYTAQLARRYQWTRLIVVSWNYHLVRARYIFRQCFDGALIMRPVPRSYADVGVARWAWIYAYQYTALIKAAVIGCGR